MGRATDSQLDHMRLQVTDGTFERLVSCHGHERAVAIVKGRDPATNADIAAWRNLGLGKRGRA